MKLFGEEIAVKAQIVNFQGLSSHADRDHLIAWAKNFQPVPKQVFVVHGEADVTVLFAKTLSDLAIPAHSVNYEEVFDLAAGTILSPGIIRKKTVSGEAPHRVSEAYSQLEVVTASLADVIRRSKGRPNKDLQLLSKQLSELIHKWEN